MTTIDNVPSLGSYALMRLSVLARKRQREASNGSRTSLSTVNAVLVATVRLLLHVAGFGLLTLAGFQWNIIAGLVVAGLSCFVMSTLMTRNADNATEVRTAPDLRTGR